MNTVIIGGSGGIGAAFIDHLLSRHKDIQIWATYRTNQPKISSDRCQWYSVDLCDEASIERFTTQIGEIDLCINAAGMLHDDRFMPEKSIKQFDPEYFLKSMSVNAMPTLVLAKHLQSCFKHRRPAVFATVSARVGSIEENYLGGWYSYRASKAALNMALKTLSIEWKRTLPNVAVAALHPGTTQTALSQPFQKNVPPDQLFPPEKSVAYMMKRIDNLTPEVSGKFWSFDGEILPW